MQDLLPPPDIGGVDCGVWRERERGERYGGKVPHAISIWTIIVHVLRRYCHHIMQANCAFGADCGLPANTF